MVLLLVQDEEEEEEGRGGEGGWVMLEAWEKLQSPRATPYLPV